MDGWLVLFLVFGYYGGMEQKKKRKRRSDKQPEQYIAEIQLQRQATGKTHSELKEKRVIPASLDQKQIRKAKFEVVESLHGAGWEVEEMKNLTNYTRSSIEGIIKQSDAIKEVLDTFRNVRKNAIIMSYASVLGTSQKLDKAVTDLMSRHERGERKLTPTELCHVLKAHTLHLSNLHNQMRLEEGKSTANIENVWTFVTTGGDQKLRKKPVEEPVDEVKPIIHDGRYTQ